MQVSRWSYSVLLAAIQGLALASTSPPASLSDMFVANTHTVAIEVDITSMSYGFVDVEGFEFPVTYYGFNIVSLPAGTLPDPVPSFYLAGGPTRLEGELISVPGTPKLVVGDRVLLIGVANDANALILSRGPRSLFKRGNGVGGDVALNHAGLELASVPCDGVPTLVRPAPATDDVLGVTADKAAPVLWAHLLATIATCASQVGF